MPASLSITTPRGFSLAHAVCSYGYFVLAPNQWVGHRDLRKGLFVRPLRDTAGRIVQTVTRQSGDRLLIRTDRDLAPADRAAIRSQMSRMLRLDLDLSGWAKVHPAAARNRFGRMFRSPTLFEDIVKTMTSCNVTWPNTVNMNRRLVEQVGGGDFPTPAELAKWEPYELAAICRVGYRAERMIRLARDVAEGRLDLAWFEQPQRTTDELYDAALAIHGIGPYAAANILQLLGHFDRLPIDSETIRHFKQVHGARGDARRIAKKAAKFYDRFAPYQFIAYWYELWGDYQDRFGKSHQWDEDLHKQFTARKLQPRGG